MRTQENALIARMRDLRRTGGKAFVAYVMAGEPSLEATVDIVAALDRSGATAVEIGVPFSDPIADGPVIHAAGTRALATGVTLALVLDTVREIRKRSAIPTLLMGYWNVFRRYGPTVLDAARDAGAHGFVIPDLPASAEPAFYAGARDKGLATVLLATELTTEARLAEIAGAMSGFLYYVPRLGITGRDLSVSQAVRERIGTIRGLTAQPVCVGIGVKTREEVRALQEVADGVIVGTRIVELIDHHRREPDLPERVADLARELMS